MDSWPYSRERSRSVAFRNSTVAPSGRQGVGGAAHPGLPATGPRSRTGIGLRGCGTLPVISPKKAGSLPWGNPGMRVGSNACSWCSRLYGREGLESRRDGALLPTAAPGPTSESIPCLSPAPPWLITTLNTPRSASFESESERNEATYLITLHLLCSISVLFYLVHERDL